MTAPQPVIGHVHAPAGYYLGQIRGRGCRRWLTVTGQCSTATGAMSRATAKMRDDDKRARVLWITRDGWYEPNLVMECVRR
jgi:hypothetical protein